MSTTIEDPGRPGRRRVHWDDVGDRHDGRRRGGRGTRRRAAYQSFAFTLMFSGSETEMFPGPALAVTPAAKFSTRSAESPARNV